MTRWARWPRWERPGGAAADKVTIIEDSDGGSQDTGTTLDVDISAGAVGQLAVVDITYAGADDATITAPAGWATEFEEHTAGVGWSGTYWLLIDDAGDLDVHTWTFSSDTDASYALNFYSCVNEEQPISSTGKKNNGNGNGAQGNSTKPGGNKKNKVVLVVATAGGATATAPAGYTETVDTTATGASVATAVSNAATSNDTGNVTATLSTTVDWVARLYTISPCGSVAIPAPPINLAVGSYDHDNVVLTWDDVATDETGFEVERSLNGTSWAQIGTPAAEAETYNDTTVSAETLYYYRVRAVNANGNSAWAGPVNVTTEAVPVYPDPGTFEYWMIGEMPARIMKAGETSGTFEYWQTGELV